MNPKALQKIKATKKAPLNFDDYALLFSIIVPLFFMVMGLFFIKNIDRQQITIENLFFAVCVIGVGVIGVIFICRRFIENRTYISIPISNAITLEIIVEKMKSAFKLTHLEIEKKNAIIEAYTQTTPLSWGEKITVIHNGAEILINSRPTGQPATIYKDRLNVRRVRELVAGL